MGLLSKYSEQTQQGISQAGFEQFLGSQKVPVIPKQEVSGLSGGLPQGIQFGGKGTPTAPSTLAQGGTPGLITQKEAIQLPQKERFEYFKPTIASGLAKTPVLGELATFSGSVLEPGVRLLKELGVKSKTIDDFEMIFKELGRENVTSQTIGGLAAYSIPVYKFASPAANIIGGVKEKSISRVLGGIAESILLKGGVEKITNITEKGAFKILNSYFPSATKSEIVNFATKVISQDVPAGSAFMLSAYFGQNAHPTLEGALDAVVQGAKAGAILGGISKGAGRIMTGQKITAPVISKIEKPLTSEVKKSKIELNTAEDKLIDYNKRIEGAKGEHKQALIEARDNYIESQSNYKEARTDALMKIGNRKSFNERFTKDTGKTSLGGKPVLEPTKPHILTDIDFFKKVNDKYGHEAGDSVLAHYGETLRKHFGDNNVFRYGGEEVAIDYGNLSKAEIRSKMAQVRTETKAFELQVSKRKILKGYDFSSGEGLGKQADKNLYRSKSAGRGRDTFSSNLGGQNGQPIKQTGGVGGGKRAGKAPTKLGEREVGKLPETKENVQKGQRIQRTGQTPSGRTNKPGKGTTEVLGREGVKSQEVKTPIKEDTVLKSKVYDRLKNEIPENMREEVQYNKVNLEKDIAKAIDTVNKDKNNALDIALGRKAPPEGQTSTSVNIVIAEKALAEGNYKLYADLVKNRSLEQTKRGQEIVAEKGSVTDNSTARYVKELVSLRLDKLGNLTIRERFGKNSAKEKAMGKIDSEVKIVEEKIKGKKLVMNDALKLLDQLKCIL